VDAGPILGVSAVRTAFLDDLSTADPAEGQTRHGASVMTRFSVEDDIDDDFDDEDDFDEDEDDEDEQEEDEEETETWQVRLRLTSVPERA
jgi:hypothetical protein